MRALEVSLSYGDYAGYGLNRASFLCHYTARKYTFCYSSVSPLYTRIIHNACGIEPKRDAVRKTETPVSSANTFANISKY